jgi:hypothetical protein
MRYFSIAIIFVITGLTSLGQDKIEWSEKRLTINDFKGMPPDPSTKQSLIAKTTVETDLNPAVIGNLRTFNKQVTNYFYPYDSWVLWTDPSRLRYFQTLYDLNEWMARALRKRYNENKQLVLSGNHEKIYEEVTNEFKVLRGQYDGDSDFGNNLTGQMTWETRITERLISLSDFCKTCDSHEQSK